MADKKIIFEEHFKCPHCKKKVIVKKIRKIIEEPVKAEYEDTIVIEKDSQTTLK